MQTGISFQINFSTFSICNTCSWLALAGPGLAFLRIYWFKAQYSSNMEHSLSKNLGLHVAKTQENTVFSSNFHKFLTKTWNNQGFSPLGILVHSCSDSDQ